MPFAWGQGTMEVTHTSAGAHLHRLRLHDQPRSLHRRIFFAGHYFGENSQPATASSKRITFSLPEPGSKQILKSCSGIVQVGPGARISPLFVLAETPEYSVGGWHVQENIRTILVRCSSARSPFRPFPSPRLRPLADPTVFTDMKSPDFDYGEFLQGRLGIVQPSTTTCSFSPPIAIFPALRSQRGAQRAPSGRHTNPAPHC